MGDKHLYDGKGNYVGRISERGPSSSRSSPGEDRTMLIALALSVLGGVWGYFVSINDSLFDKLVAIIFFVLVGWFLGLGIGKVVEVLKGH